MLKESSVQTDPGLPLISIRQQLCLAWSPVGSSGDPFKPRRDLCLGHTHRTVPFSRSLLMPHLEPRQVKIQHTSYMTPLSLTTCTHICIYSHYKKMLPMYWAELILAWHTMTPKVYVACKQSYTVKIQWPCLWLWYTGVCDDLLWKHVADLKSSTLIRRNLHFK